ncbi:ESPR-type extended signal peptide-containing protein [Burkholderia seminalis]|uniref:ESPR-type extended signal peptide-containing protein n=1 Tax=Burkholderia seminalis TaxID=488731 RepID=UPI00265314E9|nr:ESPR-type extended signal peptide-containing protein [Burkholderia seminalis]MDN7586083.1 ESPR-type extended signal peptide-containing protein [Burkholderia seminalis]
MNKTYRSVWNAVTNTWTAAAETAKSHSKGSARAARQAVIAIALGGAAIGSAAAAETCTTADGSSGTVDAAGVCKAVNDGAIGTMGVIGTMAADDTTYVKVNSTGAAAAATGANAVAIGQTVRSGGSSSVAVGSDTTASGLHSIALGASARNNDASDRQIAIGSFAQTAGRYTTAIGYQASATVEDALALGHASSATNTGTVAIGASATSGGTGSTVIGQSAAVVSGANNAIALGMNARVANSNSAAIGSNAFASNNYSSALGTSASSTGLASTALGSNSTATGSYSLAIGSATGAGRGAVATGTSSIAIGTLASASANNAVALGYGTVADRNNTVSVGAGVPNADGSTFTRQIVNVAAGTEDNDAVNVAQMNAGLSTTNAAIAATNLNVSSLSTGLSSTNSTVGGLSTGLSSTNSTVAGLSTGLTSTNSAVAGLSTGLSSTNSTVAGLSTGLSSTSSTVAGLSTGLSSTSSTVAGLSTGLSSTNSTVAGLSTGLSSTNSAVAGLSTGLSSTTSTVASHTTQIGDLDDKLSKLESGTSGLVQQVNPGDDITVGANTDGNAVNFSSKTGARKLAGVAAGDVSATSTEAVNGSQLHGVSDSVAAAIGGNSKVNSDGSISAPAFTVGDGSGGTKIVNSVGDVVTNLDGRTTTNEGDIKKLADDIGSGTLGLVQQANPGDDITVGANTDGNAVNFSSKTGARKLAGVAAGDVSATSTEAVNGSQLHGVSDSVAAAIGGNSKVNSDGSISAPSFTVGDGSGGTKIVNSVGDVVTNLDGRTTTNEGDIKKLADDIGSGTLGLVQQANPGDDITVGANTDGNAVNFSGKTGARKLAGVAAGDVSVTSTEAVNGSQLHGVSDSVAAAIGGNSKVNSDGSISAPSFTVGDGSGGTKIVNSVGDVVTNLDGRVTTNEGDIKKLADDIGSGTLGLVQQANPGDDITVGANTDGNAVNFSSKTGARKLAGVAAGDVSATSTEAVNGSQLHGVSDSVAEAIGGNSKVNSDGSISAPSFTVGDGSGGTKIVNSVGDAVTNLDGRMTTNEGGLKKLSEQFESGTLGLVQQNPTTGGITVGANTGGSVVNFAGAGGALRTLTGVANGVEEDDVVTVSQLRATGLIDYTGKEVGAVTYDLGLSFDTVTFAGSNGTLLSNVKAGVADMDAVNVSQLNALQQQFADQYARLDGQFGDLSNRFDDLSDRLGELETNPGTGGPGTGGGSTVVGEGAVATGENSSAIGDSALASGENSSAVGQGAVASGSNGSAIGQGSTASGGNSSAVGQGAVASGNNGSAIGQGAVASGENGTALGQGAVASGKDSTALGQGASATGSGSVAIGQGSVATEANTVSFGDGTAEGNRRLVNIADGINASDAATKGQLDRAMESVDQRFNDTNRAINDVAKNAYAGIAAAMAMPNMTPSQPGKTVVAVGAANFKSGSAIAAGATYRSRNGSWLVNGATSITSVGDVGVRAQVGYEF